MGGALEITMSDWADQCHEQGGHGHHPALPAAERRAGRADRDGPGRRGRDDPARAVQPPRVLPLPERRLPAAAGRRHRQDDAATCRSGSTGPTSSIPDDQEFSYEEWCRNLALGRTFLSGGPLLRFTVEGQRDRRHALPAGQRRHGPGRGRGRVDAADPPAGDRAAGRVVASTEVGGRARAQLRSSERLPVTGSTWLAARVSGPGYYQADPAPRRLAAGHLRAHEPGLRRVRRALGRGERGDGAVHADADRRRAVVHPGAEHAATARDGDASARRRGPRGAPGAAVPRRRGRRSTGGCTRPACRTDAPTNHPADGAAAPSRAGDAACAIPATRAF